MDDERKSRTPAWVWRFSAAAGFAAAIEAGNLGVGHLTTVVALEPAPVGAYAAGTLLAWPGILGWTVGQALFRLFHPQAADGLTQTLGLPMAYGLLGLVGYLVFASSRTGRGLPSYRSYLSLVAGAASGGLLLAMIVGLLLDQTMTDVVSAAATFVISVIVVAPALLVPLVRSRLTAGITDEKPPRAWEVEDGLPLRYQVGFLGLGLLTATVLVVLLERAVPEIGGWLYVGYLLPILWASWTLGLHGGLLTVTGAAILYNVFTSTLERDAMLEQAEVLNFSVPFFVISLVASALGAGRELEARARREADLLRQLSDCLLGSVSIDEALDYTRQAVGVLPGTRGTVLLRSGGELKEWRGNGRGPWSVDGCWAMRRGRVHRSDDADPLAMVCAHVDDPTEPHLCLPLLTQGEAFGVLHLAGPEILGRQALATSMASQVAMTLASLRLRSSLAEQAARDELTGLHNRRHAAAEARRLVEGGGAAQGAVLMIDVDHFKRVNDTHGHAAGDAVLRGMAELLRGLQRRDDVVSRWGGEEVLVLLPGAPLQVALDRAETIRQSCRERQRWEDWEIAVTVSIGVAAWPDHESALSPLVAAADAALYEAKNAGRDRVVVAS